ncbi:hypothetical protein GGI24_004108 [Coemansia furcata]|nr:hypothetical protein GGI24_004108 [Coemansia furcata]
MPTFITDESMMFPQPIDINTTAPHILGGGTISDSFRAFPSVISELSLVQMSQSQPASQMVPTYTDSQPMVYFENTQFSSQTATLPYDDSQHASHGGLPYNASQPPVMIPVRPYASQPVLAGRLYDTQPAMVGRLPHDGAALTSRTKQCANCQATDSPTWRRHRRTQLNVCNACGLYFNLHAKEREFVYNARGQRVVKRQPRGSGRRNQRNRVTNPLILAPSAPQPAHSSVPQQPSQSSAPQHPRHSSVLQIPNYSSTVDPVTSGMEYMNASYVSSQLTHYMATQNSYQDNTIE